MGRCGGYGTRDFRGGGFDRGFRVFGEFLPVVMDAACVRFFTNWAVTFTAFTLMSQFALFRSRVRLFELLIDSVVALRAVSTIITPSWSEISGITDTLFISPGLLVQNKSITGHQADRHL